jgi:hypothetical protein
MFPQCGLLTYLFQLAVNLGWLCLATLTSGGRLGKRAHSDSDETTAFSFSVNNTSFF